MTVSLSEWTRRLVAVAALVLIGAQTMPAAAVSKKVERACRADFKRLCPSYNPDSASARACMESKSNEISSICMNALIDAGEVDRRRARRS